MKHRLGSIVGIALMLLIGSGIAKADPQALISGSSSNTASTILLGNVLFGHYETSPSGSLVCGSGLTSCGNFCANLTSDQNNCNECGNSCLTDLPSAIDAQCCSSTCVDVTGGGDPSNCGSCGHSCTGSDPACCSGGTCADLDSDSGNCGACGNACIVTDSCVNGTCTCDDSKITCTMDTDCCSTDDICVSGACVSD